MSRQLTRRSALTAGVLAAGAVLGAAATPSATASARSGGALEKAAAAGIPPALARWEFAEAAAPFAASTPGISALAQAPGSTARRVATPFGGGVEFNGTTDRLRVAASDVGALNVGATTGAVTVAAWVSTTDSNNAIIAGCWQESRRDPRRSYALFNDLPMYGGDDMVCMEVSRHGDATPGYPFSIDYAVERRKFTRGRWQLHVGTYDGAQAIAYLDGYATAFPSYTDPQGATYAKNPYRYTEGLNPAPVEFTVGAVVRDSELINLHRGRLARLRVWDRALTAAQVRALWDAERWRVA